MHCLLVFWKNVFDIIIIIIISSNYFKDLRFNFLTQPGFHLFMPW